MESAGHARPSRLLSAPPRAVIAQSLHAGASLLSPQAAEQKGQRLLRSPQGVRNRVLRDRKKPGKVEDGKGMTAN
jgi:hypothetical protein